MVGKSQIKFIKSLHQKKYRNQHALFIVEGIKTVQELLDSDFEAYKVYSTEVDSLTTKQFEIELISEVELMQITSLKTPNKVLGIFKIPQNRKVDSQKWVLALDDIRDPGNLGTIIRLCDWFGITNIVCSKSTVDCYNPKVLQATMGSITRVNIVYTDLVEYLSQSEGPVYGTFMNGKSVYDSDMSKQGIVVMGNEANGISKPVEALVTTRIGIPRFGGEVTESLNVATATAIILSEIRRA